MGFPQWFAENWFVFLQSIGIIASLLFTAFSLRSAAKTRLIANLLTITANHRQVWIGFTRNPALSRVLDAAVDPLKQRVTDVEEAFVNLVILHISSVYYAMQDELVIKLEGLRRDVAEFIALPIPRMIWEKTKLLQNDDFVAFVESCRNWK